MSKEKTERILFKELKTQLKTAAESSRWPTRDVTARTRLTLATRPPDLTCLDLEGSEVGVRSFLAMGSWPERGHLSRGVEVEVRSFLEGGRGGIIHAKPGSGEGHLSKRTMWRRQGH